MIRPGLVCAALLCWACGGKNVSYRAPEEPPEESGASVAPPAQEILDAGVDRAPASDGGQPPPALLPGIAEEEGVATGSATETDRLARAVSEILSLRCGSCHDGDRSDGGLGQVHDLAQLIAAGVIVPGSSATSPLVQVLLGGSMHSMTSLGATLTTGELSLVSRFVDRLPSAEPAACAALAQRSNDDVYAALLADAQAASASNLPFLRYVGLTYASNGGSCGAALERQREALLELVNSVSTAPEIHVPAAIDADSLLFRIDLRDYGWNRELDLQDDGSPDFADAWLALTAATGPYALELTGPEADELKRLTGTAVPFLPVNALVHAASAGDLYYALVGARRTGDATRAQLGVNLQVEREDLSLRYAGFSVNAPWSSDRRVTRAEQRERPGLYYWSLEEDARFGASSIYEDPLGFAPSEPVPFIYNLANGLQAYGIEDLYGSWLTSMPTRCAAAACDENALLNGVGCQACHEQGLVATTDSVREIFEANTELFDNDTAAAIRVSYPGEPGFGQLITEGSQLHLDALQRAGVTASGPEPTSFVYYQFERDGLGLRRAAGELGVTPEQLRTAITSASGSLGPLLAPDGVIRRSAFDSAYVATRCALAFASRNRPAACP